MTKDESEPERGLRCQSCGEVVDKVFQYDMCKPCLLQSFQRLTRVIDYYRAGNTGGGPEA